MNAPNLCCFFGKIIGKTERKVIDGRYYVIKITIEVSSDTGTLDGKLFRAGDFAEIIFLGKVAENVDHLPRLTKVFIEARMQGKSLSDKDGIKRFVTEFFATHVTQAIDSEMMA